MNKKDQRDDGLCAHILSIDIFFSFLLGSYSMSGGETRSDTPSCLRHMPHTSQSHAVRYQSSNAARDDAPLCQSLSMGP